MTTLHGPVMIRHSVQAISVIIRLLWIPGFRIGNDIRLEIKSRQRKIYGGILLLEPSVSVSETIEMDDDYRCEFHKIEFLCRLSWNFTVRTFPFRYCLATDIFLNALLKHVYIWVSSIFARKKLRCTPWKVMFTQLTSKVQLFESFIVIVNVLKVSYVTLLLLQVLQMILDLSWPKNKWEIIDVSLFIALFHAFSAELSGPSIPILAGCEDKNIYV